jgi:hypothetical protein
LSLMAPSARHNLVQSDMNIKYFEYRYLYYLQGGRVRN